MMIACEKSWRFIQLFNELINLSMVPMRVTFDTNSIDKAARPDRHPKDPLYNDYLKVNEAIAAGKIEGFFCETVMTIEGIKRVDRAKVLNSTNLKRKNEPAVVSGNITIVPLTLTAEQPERQPLHPEVKARIVAAVNLGFKILSAPRIGGFKYTDSDGNWFYKDVDEPALSKRLDKYNEALRAIEQHGSGISVARQLAATYAKRADVQEPWYKSLIRTKDIHEERAVERAVAEWADADSVAAHIGYGIDLFCTSDSAKSAGKNSVFSSPNRTWLESTYGVKFITMSELAKRFL